MKFINKPLPQLLVVGLTTLSFPAFSADDNLSPMVVTANRSPTANVLAPTSVITRDDIERLQIYNLPTLLSRQTGIDMVQQGGAGKLSSIFIRGTNAGHVLVLVDGVRWSSATVGTSAFQNFPVDQIERIEIVRGPRSSLYGSEAIGGVIQIFTRKGSKGENRVYGRAGYGTHNSKEVTAGVSGGTEKTIYSLNYAYQSTDGINALENNNPDKDGYRNNSLSASLQHQFSDRVSLGFSAVRAEGHNSYDGFEFSQPYHDYTDKTVQQVLAAKASYDVLSNWNMEFDLGESRDQADNFTDGTLSSVFNTRRRSAAWQNTVSIVAQQKLILGLDYYDDVVDGTTDYVVDSRDNKAAFASWQGGFGHNSFVVSARHDDNEAFGNHNTGSIDWGYQLKEALRLTASIGTGFKAPTFNDLYFPPFFGFQGNPDLKPETSRSYEIGLDGDVSWGYWAARAYENKIDDLISITTDFSTMENIDKARIRGVELELTTELLGWETSANISLLDPEDETTGKQLARRARQLANIDVHRGWGDLTTGVAIHLRGKSYNDAANTQELAGYGLVDLEANYALGKGWSLEGRIHNLFDKDYVTALDFTGVNAYQNLGATFFLAVAYRPE